MRTIVLRNGILSGLVMVGMVIFTFFLMGKGVVTFDNSEVIGYSSMIVALSLIFFGVKSYRDKHQSGVISFGKGLRVGLLITAVAAVVYATGWEVYYRNAPGVEETFMDEYAEYCINKLRHEGATEEKIEKTRKEMTDMKEMYKNPFVRFGFTMVEILPVGIIITLVSAGVLRKRHVLPA